MVSKSSLLKMSLAQVEQLGLVFVIHALHMRSPKQFKQELIAFVHSVLEHEKYQYFKSFKMLDFTKGVNRRKKAKYFKEYIII